MFLSPLVCEQQVSLVIQDYFTKWADAIPMPDQKAQRITKELVKVFATFGLPQILHSDQSRNFESTILKQTLDAFGVSKSHATAYHPQGDGMVERFNRSLLQMLRAYAEIGNSTSHPREQSLLPSCSVVLHS